MRLALLVNATLGTLTFCLWWFVFDGNVWAYCGLIALLALGSCIASSRFIR